MVGPFSGTVKEKRVEYGDYVERGQSLILLDITDIDLQYQEAEAQAIKARQELKLLETWATSSDVMRARNGVLSVQIKHDDTKQKFDESRGLYDKGLISRIELAGLEEEEKTEGLQLSVAEEELAVTLKKGDAENLHLARLQHETSEKRVSELKRQVAAGDVTAAMSGLILRPVPPSGTGNGVASLEVGSKISAGQPMFMIANADALQVVAQVDEIDVNRIKEGASVEITGDAFGGSPIVGRVARISAQAEGDQNNGSTRSATFRVAIDIPTLDPAQRSAIRIGMSAKVSITVYQNPNAIILPPNFVVTEQSGHFVWIQKGDEMIHVPVVVGQAVEDGIEILDGLRSGDIVVASGTTNFVRTVQRGSVLGSGAGRLNP
jgi:multidrug efflux pump subunit AcrA (membrane-fusion protein)